MSLFALILLLIGLGLVWYLVAYHLPLPPPAKTVVHVVFVVILILLILQLFGIGDIRIGR